MPELVASEAKYVLIHGDEVVDVYGTYEDAIKEGYSRFKLEPFWSSRFIQLNRSSFVSRLVPCHTSPAK